MRRILRHIVSVLVAGSCSLCGALLGVHASSASSGTLGADARPAQAAGGRYAVVIVIDAARADEVNLAQLPNLAALAHRGVVYRDAWVGQLPSITEASHATIGTGVFPSRHKIYGEIWRMPGTETMSPDLLDSAITRTGYIGKAMVRAGVPSLAGLIKSHDPGALVASISGHKIYAADAMGSGQADFVAFGTKEGRGHYVPSAIPGRTPVQSVLGDPSLDLPSYPRKPGIEDAWVGRLAARFVSTYAPRLLMVNLPEVDTYGHTSGTNAMVMRPLMKAVDATIGHLVDAYRQAHILDQTDWIVTADHGMVPATSTVTSDAVQRVVHSAGGNLLYLGHGDYCTLWLRNPDSVGKVASALSHARLPHISAVYERTVQGSYRLASPLSLLADPNTSQTYSDLLATQDSAEGPDVILMFDENTITMTPSLLKIGRKGDHGGATWGAQHIPMIMAGPGIRSGYVSAYPARLVDIAPTIESLLGVTPSNQDGVPLADGFTSATESATVAQQAVTARLTSDVGALIQEATLRPNVSKKLSR